MSGDPLSIGLLSDFNTYNLALLLKKHAGSFVVHCREAPYGQTMSVLLDDKSEFWAEPYDALVLWTLPERLIPSFSRVIAFEEFSVDDILSEVDAFAAQIQRIPETVWTIILPSWIALGVDRGLGCLDLANNRGVANMLMRMNMRMADNAERDRRIVLLDAQRWLSAAGTASFNQKLWYMSKTPFHSTVFQEASSDILATISGIRGLNKKVLVLDLDGTLWDGIVGDIGWEKLRLGGHDPVGEAFVDFQKELKRVVNRGVLLAIASKNEEATALEAIRRHPEMVLKLEDFAMWKINWHDKAANIADIMSSLNLGLESAVFLDDSAFERARVREALPQIFVPELPADPMQYPSFLRSLKCFDSPMISMEDRIRTKMYVADQRRSALKTEANSIGEWLEKLDLSVTVEPLNHGNLERAAQLFNKTNQMNLSTRRLTAAELFAWAETENQSLWTFRVSDRFGEYGLCGICSLVCQGAKGWMRDFLLSCRVMGRGVEEAMVCVVAQRAKTFGCTEIYTEFVPTAKNSPCERWLINHPNLKRESNIFRLSLVNSLDFHPHVRITMA